MSYNKSYGVYTFGDKTVLPTREVHSEPMTFHEAKRLRDKFNGEADSNHKASIRPIDEASMLMPHSTQFQVLMLRMYLDRNPDARTSEYKHKMRGV